MACWYTCVPKHSVSVFRYTVKNATCYTLHATQTASLRRCIKKNASRFFALDAYIGFMLFKEPVSFKMK